MTVVVLRSVAGDQSREEKAERPDEKNGRRVRRADVVRNGDDGRHDRVQCSRSTAAAARTYREKRRYGCRPVGRVAPRTKAVRVVQGFR